MLLAIDTSTAIAGIALFAPGAAGAESFVLVEHTWRAGQRHTTQLIPRIERLLADVDSGPADLTGIGVALGPGSFNGIRVGIATAKLLALSLDLPLAGVSTLEATAYAHLDAASLATLAGGRTVGIRPLGDAGRAQIATALYRADPTGGSGGGLVEIEPPRIADLGDVLADDPGGVVLFCGEVKPEWEAEIARRAAAWAVVATPASRLRRAGSLAELCWRRLQAGHAADPATLQAIYLRRPPVLDRESLPELG